MKNEKFIPGMNWTPSPNAAITLPGANASEDTLIVELSHPRFDAKTGDLVYTAKIIKDYQKGNLSDFLPQVDAGIAESFGQATLFIDDADSSGWICPQECFDNCRQGQYGSPTDAQSCQKECTNWCGYWNSCTPVPGAACNSG